MKNKDNSDEMKISSDAVDLVDAYIMNHSNMTKKIYDLAYALAKSQNSDRVTKVEIEKSIELLQTSKIKNSSDETVHESLAVLKQMILNLEKITKELVTKIEQLRYNQSVLKDFETDKNKYWPNIDPPPRRGDIVWDDNSSKKWNL
jgi:DNA replicative helicase MCM subunit Mcm2 (Cdc46/Mcm family)